MSWVRALGEETYGVGTPFSRWLAGRLDQRGVGIRQAAKYMGVAFSALAAYRRGEMTPGLANVRKMARYFGVSEDDILRLLPPVEGPIWVPVVTQTVSAGPGSTTDPEYLPFYPQPEERGHQFFAARVSGCCMEPRILEGHWVIVNATVSPHLGDLVLVMADGEALVKELASIEGDLWLVAIRDVPPIRVTPDVRIQGVVRFAFYRP